jgi:hypothetical protein
MMCMLKHAQLHAWLGDGSSHAAAGTFCWALGTSSAAAPPAVWQTTEPARVLQQVLQLLQLLDNTCMCARHHNSVSWMYHRFCTVYGNLKCGGLWESKSMNGEAIPFLNMVRAAQQRAADWQTQLTGNCVCRLAGAAGRLAEGLAAFS